MSRSTLVTQVGPHPRPKDPIGAQLFDLNNYLEDLYDDSFANKVVEQRFEEYKSAKGVKNKPYLILLKNENVLVTKLTSLQFIEHSNREGFIVKKANVAKLKEALKELQDAVKKVTAELLVMTKKLMQSPSRTVEKDIQLLVDIASNLEKYYIEPDNAKNLKNLMNSSALIQRKINPGWRGLKTALVAAIGVGCIIVGLLGLVPSFGASIGLVAIGSALLSLAGVAGFWPHKKAKEAHAFSQDIKELCRHANTLISLKITNVKKGPEIGTTPQRRITINK